MSLKPCHDAFHTHADLGIDPLINVKRNASFKGRGCMRKFAVVKQLGKDGWKRKMCYGYR